ncbi:MAG TPA: Rieske (2Fe-2S) protein, partial [Magnetospirillaceae bacterium]|nr:Rieske (2Fe-2S) protein [Magnetospirillaceae bacterium]
MSADWPVALAEGWHPVALLEELRPAKPLARSLLGVPLVLFRGKNRPAILRDVCPHRNVPLSPGQVQDGVLTCPYHGWRFGEDGLCLGAAGSSVIPAASARPFPTVVRDGLLWTCLA